MCMERWRHTHVGMAVYIRVWECNAPPYLSKQHTICVYIFCADMLRYEVRMCSVRSWARGFELACECV